MEIIEKVKEMIAYGLLKQEDAEKYIPELAESEYERTKKDIIFYIAANHKDDGEKARFLYWFKKLGEQKPVVIIPKFRIGDSIKTTNEEPLTITKITDSGYWSEDLFICNFDDAAKWELVEQKSTWSEEDKKYFNILISLINNPNARGMFDYHKTNKSACNNWLKSLKDRVGREANCTTTKEWSEEDETVLNNLIYALANDRIGNNRDEYVDWLKSIRHLNWWKPTEEQMEALLAVKTIMAMPHRNYTKGEIKAIESLYEKFKAL